MHGASPLRSGRRTRRAFTLLELLAVLLILAVLSGASAIVWPRTLRTDPQKEAHRVALWLTRAFIKSGRTRRAFSLECAPNVFSPALTLVWQRPLERDTLEARGGCLFNGHGNSAKSFYSPQWNTLTPAATIRIRRPEDGAEHFVVISGYARVRTSPMP